MVALGLESKGPGTGSAGCGVVRRAGRLTTVDANAVLGGLEGFSCCGMSIVLWVGVSFAGCERERLGQEMAGLLGMLNQPIEGEWYLI